MRVRVFGVAAGLAAIMSGLSWAQPQTAAVAQADAAAGAPKSIVKKKDKLVCESVRVTGTRMPTRVCRTLAERERLAEESRKWQDRVPAVVPKEAPVR